MASPSGTVWVETAAFSSPFKKSAISCTVLFFVFACIFSRLFSNILECRLDPVHVLHHRVWLEMEPRGALEARLCPDGALYTPGCALQALPRPFEILVREHAVEDGGGAEVRAHPNPGHRHEAPEARVRQ